MPQKKFKLPLIDKNPIEAVTERAFSAAAPVLKGMAHDALEQTLSWDEMLGTNIAGGKKASSGEMAPGQEVSLSKGKNKEKPSEEKQKPRIEAAMDYTGEIIHAETRIRQSENRELEYKIQEIMIELKKLASSSKELEVAFEDISVEQRPVNPGKYHLNFFEWMLLTIRTARMKIEDSANWASMFSSKKTKREYWSLFKKHGTSFGLSGERVVATQTG